jgi:hypothetical protein
LSVRWPVDPNGVRFTDVLAVHVECEEFCGELPGKFRVAREWVGCVSGGLLQSIQ